MHPAIQFELFTPYQQKSWVLCQQGKIIETIWYFRVDSWTSWLEQTFTERYPINGQWKHPWTYCFCDTWNWKLEFCWRFGCDGGWIIKRISSTWRVSLYNYSLLPLQQEKINWLSWTWWIHLSFDYHSQSCSLFPWIRYPQRKVLWCQLYLVP